VTIAIATVVEALNVLESTMRTSPPFVRLLAAFPSCEKQSSRGGAERSGSLFLIGLDRPRNIRLENEQLVSGETIESLLGNAEIL